MSNQVKQLIQLKNQNKVIFLVTTVLKLGLFALFSSEYSMKLFHPFVEAFSKGNLNPWQFYYEENLSLDAFPYHPLMLYIFTPITYLINALNLTNISVVNFLFKLPLFFADLAILKVLLDLFPLRKINVWIFYFLNPVILYSTYIHAQLDIIPMAFLIWSVYCISMSNFKKSALAIGLAMSTKIHVFAALPLLLFYLMKVARVRDAVIFIFISLGIFVFLDAPFLTSQGFWEMVLLNSKQTIIFDSYLEVGPLKILLPISAVSIVYLHFFNQNSINQDLLYFYFGLLFAAILLFIYPAPAWYVWITPFVVFFFIRNTNEKKKVILYSSFSALYLIYFLFFYTSPYVDILFLTRPLSIRIDNPELSNIAYSALVSVLLAMMYAFYKYGVKSNSLYRKGSNLIIGIGGDSAVGKTSLLNLMSNIFRDELLTLEGDGEHKWERGNENWNRFTHLDPKANYIHKQAEVIRGLKFNKRVYRSDYDHSTGKFTKQSIVNPKRFIVIAGLHPFYLPKQRRYIDLKIFLDTSEDLRKHWKVLRDVKKRGYSPDKVIEQIEARYEDGSKFIAPQKDFADLVVEYYPISDFLIGDEEAELNIGLKIVVDANVHLEDLLNEFQSDLVWDYNEDLKTQYVDLREEPNLDFKLMAEKFLPNIHELTASDAKWSRGYAGFLQLITLMMVSEKLKEG